MSHDDKHKAELLDHLAALIRAKLHGPEAHQVEQLTRHYYDASNLADLQDYSPEDLYGAALSHWRLAQRRRPGETSVHVYNPDYDQHGWQSTHTIVEIVTDDMPFLVDTVSMELLRAGYAVHAMLHPVLRVKRGEHGELNEISGRNGAHGTAEAMMRFEVTRETDSAALAALRAGLDRVLADVRAAVEDWRPMRARIGEIIATLADGPLPIAAAERQETLAFLRWVDDDHFTFIGFRAYDLVTEAGEDVLRHVAGSGLGVLRDSGDAATISQSFAHIPAPLRAQVRAPTLLIITKSTRVSTVHRPVHLDYIGIKRYNAAGELIGEWRFLGLYSSLAYSARPSDIPLLRKKVEHVIDRAGFAPASHGRKALVHILDTFPRDEMFQFSEDELFEVATGILQVQERRRLGLFLRKDLYGRFVTALVYVPRDRYHTELRRRIQDILMQAFDGQNVEFNIEISESPLARVHFIIRTRPEHLPDYDRAELETRMVEAMLSWQDELQTTLYSQLGEEQGAKLHRRYHDAFPPAYRDDYSPRTAVMDIERLETLDATQPLVTHLYRPQEQDGALLRFKIYGRAEPMALSDALPMLERMGLRVLGARPYRITPRSGAPYWILDFDMIAGSARQVDVMEVKEFFQDTFIQLCSGGIENDGFNRLVLLAELHWRQVVVLRALCKYLLQTRIPFSQHYIEASLANHPAAVKLLVALFEACFDPGQQQEGASTRIADLTTTLEHTLAAVTNLDEDRILRHFLGLIQAMLRTNYYQPDRAGHAKPYLSFKFESAKIANLPLPRPLYEISVYSPRMEGIHLRGGPVARGGIRWSDRREDFRTEILGLMKAQMVKNAVIVPVGAKGGFICKRLPAGDDRDALQDEVIHCYRCLIRGMLDLTDNWIDGKIAAPLRVVRYDGDDPYLVVAADKGTASFSDIANNLSAEYNFWLGDAFASGGSSGYDHKKMAITARGAWESVKRHFRELGKNSQTEDFTVVGIGDMAGDVFGNGMLLSPHIKLIAAFNHLHIFIDPAPDPARSLEERQRLFGLPRSAWSDYNRELISAGGGVYSRRAKAITLGAEARAALGIEAEQLAPNELIQAILRAPVDLLWNGGIGTFVKAGSESHADVGDRSNDALRVDAGELRCRVVGEGGNLGFTQLARVEYARRGGRINTDAIDNSGGVDCSDHEVNIKILLDQIVAAGELTLKQRNRLLVDMTDEVASLVLNDNYLQPQAISIAVHHGPLLLDDHVRLIRLLEKEGRIKRKLESLPSDDDLAARDAAQEGLTRPEIAVLLAYSKIRLFESLLESDVAEDAFLSHELVSYFPSPLRERYVRHMDMHPLKREIIANQITNGIINRMGSTFWLRMHDASGHHPADIARAYTAAREIFAARTLWREVEALDNRLGAAVQIDLFSETRRLLDRATLWLLRQHRAPLDIAATLARYTHAAAALAERLPQLTKGAERRALQARARRWQTAGVDKELALRIAALEPLFAALDLTEIATETGSEIDRSAEVYFALGATLDLNWLKENIHALPRRDPWQRRARTGLLDELQNALRALATAVIVATPPRKTAEQRVAAWVEQNRVGVEHTRALLGEIRASGRSELAMLSVAARELRAFAQSEAVPRA